MKQVPVSVLKKPQRTHTGCVHLRKTSFNQIEINLIVNSNVAVYNDSIKTDPVVTDLHMHQAKRIVSFCKIPEEEEGVYDNGNFTPDLQRAVILKMNQLLVFRCDFSTSPSIVVLLIYFYYYYIMIIIIRSSSSSSIVIQNVPTLCFPSSIFLAAIFLTCSVKMNNFP